MNTSKLIDSPEARKLGELLPDLRIKLKNFNELYDSIEKNKQLYHTAPSPKEAAHMKTADDAAYNAGIQAYEAMNRFVENVLMVSLCKERDALKQEFIQHNSDSVTAHVAGELFLATRQNKAFDLLAYRLTQGTLQSDGPEAIANAVERNLAIAEKFDNTGTFFSDVAVDGQEGSTPAATSPEASLDDGTPSHEESFS